MPPGGFAAQALMAARKALRVASRRELLVEPPGARMLLSAPLVPLPASHLAVWPLTVKVWVEAGAQDSSCWPFTVTEVMRSLLPAVLMVMMPVAAVVPIVVAFTVIALPFSVVPVAIDETTTLLPLCAAT
jgi:hypothetical protein